MTSRERFISAVRGGSPDRVPVILPYFHLYLDHIVHELTGLTWAHRMFGSPEEKAAIFRLAYTWFELDWLPVGGVGTSLLNLGKELVERDGVLCLSDPATGAVHVLPAQKPAEPPIAERKVTDPDDVDADGLPQVLAPGEILETGVLEPARKLSEEFGSDVMIVSGASMPGNQNYFYLGVYDMMTALREEPDLVHFLVDRSKRMIVNLLEAMAAAGIGCVWLEDNFVGGDLISRDDYETFFFRANADIIAAARNLGLVTVYYLTGEIMSRMPYILEMRPDCLAFEESKKTFTLDPVEIRLAAGRDICLFGNVDVYADIERGDERTWDRVIRRQIEAACPDGRFVLSAGSPVTHDTPKEKVRDFIRFAKNFKGVSPRETA